MSNWDVLWFNRQLWWSGIINRRTQKNDPCGDCQASHAWWGGFRAKAEFDVCFREFAMCVCHKPSRFLPWCFSGCTKQRMATIYSDLVLVMLSWHLSVRWVSCFISDSRSGGIRTDQMPSLLRLQQWKKYSQMKPWWKVVVLFMTWVYLGPICFWRDYHAWTMLRMACASHAGVRLLRRSFVGRVTWGLSGKGTPWPSYVIAGFVWLARGFSQGERRCSQ